VLLQTTTPGAGGLAQFLPLILIVGIFYLIVLLPARRKQKKLQEMIDNLKTGDKVITTGVSYSNSVMVCSTAMLSSIRSWTW